MTLEWLLIALIIGIAWQPTLERMGTAGIFVGVNVGFFFLFDGVCGPLYYIAGASFGLVIMYALSCRYGRLSGVLQAFCLVDIMANMAGCFNYIGYNKCDGYNNLYEVFYSCAVMVLFAGGPYGWATVGKRLLPGRFRLNRNRGDCNYEAVASENGK